MNETVKHLEALREKMRKYNIKAVIVPGTDPHQSEYISAHWKLRDWVTGFTGSNGTALVTTDEAFLWTDSRYFLQAEMELAGTGVTMMKEDGGNDPTIEQWLAENLEEGDLLAVNGKLFSLIHATRLENLCGEIGARFATDFDPFPEIYTDRPQLPTDPIFEHKQEYCGESTNEKIERLLEILEAQDANAIFLSALDEFAWIFNIRCSDVLYNPVAISYAYISTDKRILFIDEAKIDAPATEYLKSQGIETMPYEKAEAFLAKVKNDTILLDPNKTSDTIARTIQNCQVIYKASPIAIMKAVKNDTQVAGVRNAMVRDGVALVKLYMWLEENAPKGNFTEMDVAEKLIEFRKASPLYVGESFGMIAGYKEHGAIVHYEADEKSASTISAEGMLLIDTGAQYLDGTTDITRTISLGKTTAEERHDYTLVLKGHLTLGHAIFPTGTRGSQLDALARQFLWKECKTYWHGTGHGVGHFLGVHEGPQNIRLNENPTTLVPGMITSNEPGLYLAGKYGIRIENLVLTEQYRETSDFGNFLDFETLTLFPYDQNLIDTTMLSNEEIEWINGYHKRVRELLTPHLNAEQAEWLNNKTKEITK